MCDWGGQGKTCHAFYCVITLGAHFLLKGLNCFLYEVLGRKSMICRVSMLICKGRCIVCCKHSQFSVSDRRMAHADMTL